VRLLQLLSALAVALCLPALAVAQGQASAPTAPKPTEASAGKVRLSYLFSDGNIPGTLKAFDALVAERPDLKDKVDLQLLTESTLADTSAAKVQSSDVLVFDTMNEQMLAKFNAQNKTDLIGDVLKRGAVVGVGAGLLNQQTYIDRGVIWDSKARAYWTHAGPQNQLALLKFALSKAGIKGLDLPDPQLSLDFGYYYPDGKDGQVFATWDEFDAWRRAHGKTRPGAPRVAVGFFKAAYYGGDTGFLNAVIAEIERQGAEAIPIFGYPGPVAFQKLLVGPDGRPRADVGLAANFQFVDTEAPKILEKVGIPALNMITLYGRSEKEWRASKQGLSDFEGTFNLAAPELAGSIAPTVVGSKEKVLDKTTGLYSVVTSPIPSQVRMVVSRALKYAALSRKPNFDKKIALLFYNFPPGKANIGASYLNVAESLANILQRMKADGYDVGDKVPTPDEVLAAITTQARNVGGDAPGELEEMLAQGDAERIPMKEYRQWLDAMSPSLRDKVIRDWGEPEKSTLMTAHEGGETSFVVPNVRYGKVILMPQPARAWGEDLEKLYHAKDLAPPHQYVAAYAWLKNGFKADAVVHMGTHGTLEWLDGRDTGLAEDDAPDALIADMPNIYIYNVDVLAEGLVARRRSMATLVDHMVPPFKPGGLIEDLAKLGELMNDQGRNESKNPELAERYAAQVREQAIKLGIAKDTGLQDKKDWDDEDLHKVEDYLFELKDQKIPYGLHAFGRTPEQDAVNSTVEAIVGTDRSQLPDARKIEAQDMERRILESGPRELDSLMKGLGGHFVPAGMGGEPVRNPDAYPTGANFYGIDPDKVPKPAAWEMGSKLAEQMLRDHLKKTGKPLQKVSFVIWGDETMRHEGVVESQIFYLLGTKPVWDKRGKLVGVEVIPREQLGRPRVDIVIASAAEGMFSNVTKMMDEAVQKVKALDEADNPVRKNYLKTKAALIAKGVKPELADRMAGVRIFDEPPGTYNLNTSTIIAKSGSWDSDAGFANDYIRKMGHGYGNGFWGDAMPDAFGLALSGTETVVHSSSTALYGALDNDDMFMYMGGLTSAIRSLDGKDPETLITDTRDPGKPAMTSLGTFIGREFHSRYVNPTWIKGMQKEGYAGAASMREFFEYLWGWDATVTSAVDDGMWQQTFDTYVEDKQHLGMKDFFESKSPFAYQDITARMLETVRKGYWRADQQTKTKLLSEYVDSINKHGVNCTDVSCGNARLLEYVMKEAAKAGVPAPAIANARAQLEKAMGKKIEVAAEALRQFSQANDARELAERAQARRAPSALQAPANAAASNARAPGKAASSKVQQAASKLLQGLVMSEETRSLTPPKTDAAAKPPALSLWDVTWPIALLLTLLLGWRWREHAWASA
jgi:cobaltochelatase CobN